ncbi:MAG: hypothetical protein R3C27_05355 [Hyphomonadaceae bacterium]
MRTILAALAVLALLSCVTTPSALIYPELTRFILGETAMPWWWEYNRWRGRAGGVDSV